MKELLIKILKITLWVFLAALLVLVVFGVVYFLQWPKWMAFFILLICAAIGVGVYVLLKIIKRRREQQFVQEVIDQDEARLKSFSAKEQNELKVLQERWKEAITLLKKSHLKSHGNPLYVLPWYMVIGESGSGKSTAISSAKLDSPFAEVTRVQGISGTKNCDWWFFEQAIILDTAGRYAIPVDEGKDKDEWQRFLNLLLKYRRKEPIHGLIVTVGADKLLGGDPAVLEDDGKNIRRRVDEMMRVLGIKIPVYVLVTKCDLVQGMTQFSGELPEKILNQPMGYINESLTKDVPAFLTSAMQTIGDRLRNIRLLLLHQPRSKVIDPALLLFPEEFQELGKGLEIFMRSFQENKYQETPILRGLFFSSGHQEGTPYSHFLEALGLIEEKEVLPVASKGLYLNEFFSRVLPADRRLFAPTTRMLEWNKLTRNLGLVAFVLFAIAMCGILSFSFVKNLMSIRTAQAEMVHRPAMKGDFVADMATMDHFREVIVKLEEANAHWWIPRFGLTESQKLERGLKDRFCAQFRDSFLNNVDKNMTDAVPRLVSSSSDADDALGQHIVHLTRRINLLEARSKEKSKEELDSMPRPSYVSFPDNPGLKMDTKKQFANACYSYIAWRSDTPRLGKEAAALRDELKRLLDPRGANLQWLILWINKESGLPPISLVDFWGGSINLPNEVKVGPSFTRKGKAAIYDFFKELEMATSSTAFTDSNKTTFEKRYQTLSYKAWQDFASYFPKGSGRLKDVQEWQQVALKMGTETNPYSLFLDKVIAELSSTPSSDTPLWLEQVYHVQAIKLQAAAGNQGAVAKAAEQGKKVVDALKTIGAAQNINTDTQAASVKDYQEYIAALKTIGTSAGSRTQAYTVTQQAFTEDTAVGTSPFSMGQKAASKLKTSLGWGKPTEEPIARLIQGPVDFMWTYARNETSCHLQAQWDEKVLSEVQGASDEDAQSILFAPDGPVWKFTKQGGSAAAFIGYSPGRGYYAKEVMGGGLAFDPAFFASLGKGNKITIERKAKANTPVVIAPPSKEESHNVSITGMPTDSNRDAKIKPHETVVEIQCTSGMQVLSNRNYPVKKTFTWASDSCTDTTFKIKVGNTVLTKRYSGPNGFPNFLREFRSGKRVFSAADFPNERASLEAMGITTIQVNYQMSGEAPVITQPKSAAGGRNPGNPGRPADPPVQVPRKITRCW